MALRTKNAIRRSFIELLAERPFDKISVRDIAERSEVTRNTFYYYYTDIYALAEDVFETEIERLSESANSYESWQKAFLAATAFTAENKRMIQHLHSSAHRDILERSYHKTILTAILAYVRKEAEGLANGMKGEPDAFLADLGDMLDGNIRRSLERGCAHTAQ